MILEVSNQEWQDVKQRLQSGETLDSIILKYPKLTKTAVYSKNSSFWKINLRQIKQDKRNHKNRGFTDEQELDIVRHYVELGLSAPKVAAKFSCHESTVYRVLKHRNHKIRTRNDYKGQTGENSPRWQGGRAIFTKDGYRFTEEYKEWRKKVFERDKFQCILCNSKTDIEADHIKPKSKYPELVYDIDNGRTLCKKCHKNTDTYGLSAIKVKRYDEVSELNNKTFKIKPLTWNTNILEGGVTASTYFGTIKIITIKKNRYSLTMSFEEFSQSKILLSDNLEDAKSYAENVWHGILLLHLEKC